MSSGGGSSGGGARQGLLSWVVPALKNRRTLKTWFRSCVALAATLVLLVVKPTLKNMGQAAFFASIVAVFLPPSLALSLFALASFTLCLGLLIGWAWGAAAMAAGLSVRNPTLLAHQQQKLVSLVGGTPTALQSREFAFKGGFLDPRVSAVYGAFLFIGTFALGAVRAHVPKLAFLSIFGTIILDVICINGPLIPRAQYTALSNLFLLPTTYYLAIALTTLIFIFPESLNHVWLTTLQTGIIQPISKILATQSLTFAASPSDAQMWSELAAKSLAERQELLAGAKELLEQIGLVDLEFTVGRLGPGDLKRLSRELRLLSFKAAGLYAFPIFVKNVHNDSDGQSSQPDVSEPSGTKPNTAEPKSSKSEHDRERALTQPQPQTPKTWLTSNVQAISKDRYTLLQQHIHTFETKHSHDLSSLLPILSSASTDLRASCEAAMGSVEGWFRDCNSARLRWFFFGGREEKRGERREALVKHLENVSSALERWRKVERVKLVEPFERFFDQETGKRKENTERFTARSLFLCYVFSFSMDAFAERLCKFLTVIIDLDSRRPRPRFWAPSGFGMLGRKLMSRQAVDKRVGPLSRGLEAFDDDVPVAADESGDQEEGEGDYVEKDIRSARRNPDALPPTSFLGKFFVRLGGAARWLKTSEGIFSLRHAIVSVALWIPAVCHTSAWFYYSNRGIWALIMAQTALATYEGDQIASFFLRIGGTILGLLIGTAIWYIGGPGHGTGNPYGIVIATTAFTAPFLLGRIAAPLTQLQIWAMGGVTVILVVGYSWIDDHLPVLSNPGVGISIGWKRALLVVIGFTAAFIVMMFPRPTSGRTLVRRTLAATASELGHILAVEVEALLVEESNASGTGTPMHETEKQRDVELCAPEADSVEKPSTKERRVRRIAQRVFVVATRLQDLHMPLVTARFEPQIQGLWPHEKYHQLYDVQIRLLSALLLFTGGFMQLDKKWCSILVHQAPLLNPNLLSDIFSNVSIIAYALAGGHPLPPSLPRLRDRLVYHERMAAHTLQTHGNVTPDENGPSPLDTEFDPENIGRRMGIEDLTLDLLKDDHLPAHSTALFALANAIALIDEMTVIIRELCGEVTFEKINALHSEYLGQEERTLGGGLLQRTRFLR